MCNLSDADPALRRPLPPGWRLGVFGSVARCSGDQPCTAVGSDLDLVLVHPPRQERVAAAQRRRLLQDCAGLGVVADVVVLATQELESTGFWRDEGVIGLEDLTARCPLLTHTD